MLFLQIIHYVNTAPLWYLKVWSSVSDCMYLLNPWGPAIECWLSSKQDLVRGLVQFKLEPHEFDSIIPWSRPQDLNCEGVSLFCIQFCLDWILKVPEIETRFSLVRHRVCTTPLTMNKLHNVFLQNVQHVCTLTHVVRWGCSIWSRPLFCGLGTWVPNPHPHHPFSIEHSKHRGLAWDYSFFWPTG